jgi:hypothetical protein
MKDGVAPRAHSTNGGDQTTRVVTRGFCVAVVRQVSAGVHAALLASRLHATSSHLHGTFIGSTFFILFLYYIKNNIPFVSTLCAANIPFKVCVQIFFGNKTHARTEYSIKNDVDPASKKMTWTRFY